MLRANLAVAITLLVASVPALAAEPISGVVVSVQNGDSLMPRVNGVSRCIRLADIDVNGRG